MSHDPSPLAGRDIRGVLILPLKQFRDERGAVRQMLKRTDDHFVEFGEIYFSTVFRGAIKAWKSHSRATVSYACVSGLLRMVLYDGRAGSSTHGVVSEVLLGPDSYCLVVVPPGVWNGFQGLIDPESILASCPTEPVDPGEFARLDPHTDAIPYRWPVASAPSAPNPE
jgi:dTDP-4-dehydrorhamnose 3,5-epimerase